MDRFTVMQNALKTAVESYRELEQEVQKLDRARQQFIQQKHENEMVLKVLYSRHTVHVDLTPSPQRPLFKRLFANLNFTIHANTLQELELMHDDSTVYKLIGPALVKQDQEEASSNVKKRLEFIGTELKRLDNKVSDNEKTMAKRQQQIIDLQQEMQRFQQYVQQQMQAQAS